MSLSDKVYAGRRDRIRAILPAGRLFALIDCEGSNTKSLRYLCGHSTDAILLMDSTGRELLVAWDQPLASLNAPGIEVRALAEFERQYALAISAIIKNWNITCPVELTSHICLEHFEEINGANPEVEFTKDRTAERMITAMRSVKTPEEIEIYSLAAEITDKAIETIPSFVKKGCSELDLALFLERFVRENGGEGLGFETLAAGPARSFSIHPLPAFGAGQFGHTGSSILDFGLNIQGYTTDVTMTFIAKDADDVIFENAELVQQAWKIGHSNIGPGIPAKDCAIAVNEFFAQNKRTMPHSLGHGIGMDAHEEPWVKAASINILQPGHIITIEPGLYVPGKGGIRLEDDFLITENGYRQLTHSKIVFL